MKSVKKKLLIITICLLSASLPFVALAKEINLEWSKILARQEKLANESISENYQQILLMSYLADKKIQNPPYGMKLKVSKDGNSTIFSLTSFRFETNVAGVMTGFKKDLMKITFKGKNKGKKIVKTERIYIEKSFLNEESITLRILDDSPDNKEHNNIFVTRIVNGEIVMQTKFGEFKNTPANQERTKFKRKYSEYIKTLSFLLYRIAFRTQTLEEQKRKRMFYEFSPDVLSY